MNKNSKTEKISEEKRKLNLLKLLINSPTYTKDELSQFQEVTKEITSWRRS
jgi:hypothetical protein